MRNIKRWIPLVIFLALSVLLWRGLSLNPQYIPSVLVDKPVPEFSLVSLLDQQQVFSHRDLIGEVALVNVWGSWCPPCLEEHPLFMELARMQAVPIYGINYKDDPEKARQWLARYGNPYQAIGMDLTGQTAINWGVYGAPETFVIDQHGMVRYKHVGVVTYEDWQTVIMPLIEALQGGKT